MPKKLLACVAQSYVISSNREINESMPPIDKAR